MKMDIDTNEERLTGRIHASPSSLLHEEILKPQFDYELEHLLPHYIQIEKVMTLEYERMGIIGNETTHKIIELLNQINRENIVADPRSNMSDICFAIERYVESRIENPVAFWHVDRSRNDVQATAQLMFAREKLSEIIEEVLILVEEVILLSNKYASVPMPGYTHYQSAQIITVGFYFTAVTEFLQKALDKMLKVYDEINECPLGSGAMAGMELEWDRDLMAKMLGFDQACHHALFSVASKDWMLSVASEFSNFAATLSRFVTDIITWGSSEFQFFGLPDEMVGISSAMPQKKNFPVLERVRGKTAHINAYYYDMLNTQRNTPFTNLVETAKEGGSNFYTMITCVKSVLRLFTAVIREIKFDQNRLEDLCSDDFFGGFSLANSLSLHSEIPYRQAQVIAGKYIVEMLNQNRKPSEVNLSVLNALCKGSGYTCTLNENDLLESFSVQKNLSKKRTKGSTNPSEIKALIESQKGILNNQKKQLSIRLTVEEK